MTHRSPHAAPPPSRASAPGPTDATEGEPSASPSEPVPPSHHRAGDALSRSPRVVAITGALTHLGCELVRCLERDDQVERIVCLDRAAPETARDKTLVDAVNLVDEGSEARLADALSTHDVETVVHLAFRSAPRPDPTASHELESLGTLRLVNACRRSHVRRVLMWSQTLLYGAHATNPNFLTERHPLRARTRDLFFADKIDAEQEVLRFGRPGSGRSALVLRAAPILGPSVENYLTRYLSHQAVPTVLGFDPLWQLLHEQDAVDAFRLALGREVSGALNIASHGVLPLSKIIRLAGRRRLPLPRTLADLAIGALWTLRSSEAPPSFLDYLQYVCVADTERSRRTLGFVPRHTLKDAITGFAGAQRLRDAALTNQDRHEA